MDLTTQLENLQPLTIGTIAKLAGILPQSLSVRKVRKSKTGLTEAQLKSVRSNLLKLADIAHQMLDQEVSEVDTDTVEYSRMVAIVKRLQPDGPDGDLAEDLTTDDIRELCNLIRDNV